MAPGDTLLFGPFKFEPHTGRLTKRGYKIKLQPKAAAALSCLLERPGEVVSRVQLQTKLWPEGTFVDFELGIKGAINKLRDALGDDSEEPAYIQTVHGEGYRFLAPVSTVVAKSNPISASEAAARSPVLVPTSIDRRTMWFGAMVGVVAVIMPAFLVPRAARTAPVNFQSRDWVVIAAFENRTGEKLLVRNHGVRARARLKRVTLRQCGAARPDQRRREVSGRRQAECYPCSRSWPSALVPTRTRT